MKYRYSRWDGTQAVDPLDADSIMDSLSDELMSTGDLRAALQRLLREGNSSMVGTDELQRRLAELRQQELARYDLDSVLDEMRGELQAILDLERSTLRQRVGEATPESRPLIERMTRQRSEQLDRVPDDLGGRVRALRDYEFMDQAARQRFEGLLEQLQGQMVDQMVAGMRESMEQMKGQDLGAMREMVHDLNEMLARRAVGDDARFEEFMARHGDHFPPGLENLDQLMEHLQRQMAQMRSLLRSMSPAARAELAGLMDEILQDDSLRLELARMGQLMDALMPPGELTERYPFMGEEPLSMAEAMGLMERLQQIDRMESQLERGPGRLGEVERGLAENLLGREGRESVNRLGQVEELLEKAGYIERRGRRLELTARGMRHIGQKALREIFNRLRKSQAGQHNVRLGGVGTESGEDLKEYEFGDPFHLDLRETLFNSLQRGGGAPIRMQPRDFVVRRPEHASQASTVLMIDLSRSMYLRGCFLAAKKVAMALDALIRSQYPRDSLYIVGFSSHAVQIRPEVLPQLTLDDTVYGTNMQHGLQLARSLLARHRGNRQVIMVTDGEPTAHIEDGRVYFAYPPARRTIEETLREVQRCTRDQITINTFMLERTAYLADFITQVTRMNRGRAFFVEPESLGDFVLVDFVQGRQSRRAARAR